MSLTNHRRYYQILFSLSPLLLLALVVSNNSFTSLLVRPNPTVFTTDFTTPRSLNHTSILQQNFAFSPTVIINEVAWGGTAASAADEWLELYNTTAQTLTLTGWAITSTNGLTIPLSGVINPTTYYLIERTDDTPVSDQPADLITSFGNGLLNSGDTLFLSNTGTVVDTANIAGGNWPGGNGSPTFTTLERSDPLLPDSPTNWHSNDTLIRNGLDANGNPLNGTPGQLNSPAPSILPPPPPPPIPTPSLPLLIGEFLYDGTYPSTEGDEFVEVCNPNAVTLDLTGYKVGDEESQGNGEGMYQFPLSTTLVSDACVVIAKNGDQFQSRFGFLPDFEMVISYSDNPTVPNMSKYSSWGSGGWALANDGDELVVLGADDAILDSVAYRNGDYAGLGLLPSASASEPRSLQRVWPKDTNSMPDDFVSSLPTPGRPTIPPPPPVVPPSPAVLPEGMYAYWGDLHAHTTYSDGAGPPDYALALARAAGLHFYSITDHGWWLDEAEWTQTLSQTLAATVPGEFVALRGVEYSHRTAGHINVFNNDTLIQRTDPNFAELSDFYTWLAANPAVIAQFNHPDPRYGGTFADFAFQPAASPMLYLQEIGNNAQEYVTYEPSFIQSNTVGWRVAPTNNSDMHGAEWGMNNFGRTGIIAPALTEADLLEAMRARRVFATEDPNFALSLRAGGQWMGSELSHTGPLSLTIDVVDPDPEPLTVYVYDGSFLFSTLPFPTSTTQWQVMVEARPGHFFWVKAVQADGQTAYSAPIWIAGELAPDVIYLNEILPAPQDIDWDGNGVADYNDEWLELYNPNPYPVGLGGWRLSDTSNLRYDIPLDVIIPAQDFVTLYKTETTFALNNGGDTVTLTHPDGTVVDTFTYDHSPGYDETWCRLPDGGPTWSDNCGPSPTTANWENSGGGPLTVSIFEAKRLTPGAWVKIRGQVTAPPSILGARPMYVQDETSGIMIYLPKEHGLTFKLGDRVEVVGTLRSFHEEAEIVVDEKHDVDFIRVDEPLPPLPIATTSLLEPYEGMLVMLQGQAVHFQGHATMWVDDGTDWAKTYIRRSTGIRRPYIELGTPLTVVGIVSQYSEGTPTRHDYRLLLRYQDDLILPVESPELPADWPLFLPETGY